MAQQRLSVVGSFLKISVPLVTGIPSRLHNPEKCLHSSRNAGIAETAAEQATHDAVRLKKRRNAVCSWLDRRVPGLPVHGPHRHEVPEAYPLAVLSSLGNMLLFTGQASLSVLYLVCQNIK